MVSIQTNRVDTLLAIALLPYLTFLVRRSLTIGDAIEIALVVLVQTRLLMSVTGYIPMTAFENSFGGALTTVVTLAVINVLVVLVPVLRTPLSKNEPPFDK